VPHMLPESAGLCTKGEGEFCPNRNGVPNRRYPAARCSVLVLAERVNGKRIDRIPLPRKLRAAMQRSFSSNLFGGASRARTDGLVVANDALSQLSYSPTTEAKRLPGYFISVLRRTPSRVAQR
jgi:hypothetical protein